jgi:hypothetical protein
MHRYRCHFTRSRPINRLSALSRIRSQAVTERPGLETLHDDGLNDEADANGRIGRIADRVDALVAELEGLREALQLSGAGLEHYQSYRLSVALMRVDEAASGIVADQAKREEAKAIAEGQLAAFPDDVQPRMWSPRSRSTS